MRTFTDPDQGAGDATRSPQVLAGTTGKRPEADPAGFGREATFDE
jgi:hypothetical protein